MNASASSASLSTLVLWESVVYWSDWLCFLVGVPINTLLLWFIRYHTAKEMRPYARIMLQTAVFDLALLLMAILWKSITISNAQATVIYGIGLLTADGTTCVVCRWWNFVGQLLWVFVAGTNRFAIPTQFYYRFAVMGRVDQMRWVHGG